MGNPDSDSLSQNNENDKMNNNSALPRENLINTALVFLSDKKIRNQDHNLLRRFLINKGLTEEETSIAFQRLQSSTNQALITEYAQPLPRAQKFLAPVLPPPPSSPSMWHTVHNIITTITSIGGIIYALYWLWKTYISPYLFGRKPKKKPLEVSMAELEAAVGGCVADVKTIRSSIEVMADQRASDLTQGVVITRIQDVKAEINSLKALLLNRNQFPAAPPPLATGPLSIPAWQLSAGEAAQGEGEAEAEEEGTGSNGTTNGSDSSLEIVKDVNN